MYVIKHRTTGQVMPSGNRPQDAIDWASTMPEYQVSLLANGLGSVSDWLNAMERIEDAPERPDPEDVSRMLPASYRDVAAENQLDLDEQGNVLLKNKFGVVVTVIPAEKIQ